MTVRRPRPDDEIRDRGAAGTGRNDRLRSNPDLAVFETSRAL
ncbi:MAG TPA: hypothetical protein VGD07_14835 [Methylomirabilota bacterium]